jgi:hypothetical protein
MAGVAASKDAKTVAVARVRAKIPDFMTILLIDSNLRFELRAGLAVAALDTGERRARSADIPTV